MRTGGLISVLCLVGVTLSYAGDLVGIVDLAELKATNRKPAVRYAGQTGSDAAVAEPARAVVYLQGTFTKDQLDQAIRERGAAVVGQKNFRFCPNILPVIKGTEVSFPNGDDAYHNVFSYSKAKRFDLGRYTREEAAPTILFDQAGSVRLFCEIHKHMRGTVLVLETPYFTTTEADGSFALIGVPAGEYELVAWINEKLQYRKKVAISDRSKTEVRLAKP